MRRITARVVVLLGAMLLATGTAAALTPEAVVSNGSPPGPFSQNKQNEPAITADANAPNILVAGANEEIDMEPCNSGDDNSCPFTPGIGVSGVYFSFDSGDTWIQPTYAGLTARNCPDTVGPDPGCTPTTGPIGTLPWYAEAGLVSDGDPAVAIGPAPGPGGFRWANGERLYYANLTSGSSATGVEQPFRGFEAIAVSRTDDIATAAQGGTAGKNAWQRPVILSRQSNATFSDKEQIWADNASSSPHFGNVYVCWAAFLGQEKSPQALPAPLQVAVSRDGGDTWTQHQVSAAANNGQVNPADGCTVRTDSHGNAFLFGVGTSSSGGQAFELMSVSRDGGSTWSRARRVVGPVTQPGAIDPVQGRPTIDGVAGARSDLAPAPSVDIANGSPTGADATNRIVMSFVSGSLEHPGVLFTESTDGGRTWANPRSIGATGDRGYYAAPAISPDGLDVYVVYNAFTTPYRHDTSQPRSLVGVVMHAPSSVHPATATGAFAPLHRSAPGDARASSANALSSEFLGDYVYATATRDYGAAVWNAANNAQECPAVDAWRQSLVVGDTSVPKPAPEQDCPSLTFGNSDIFGGSFAP